MVFCAVWTVLVYAPVAHWIFDFSAGDHVGGWMANELGALDFAGGTAVEINSGAVPMGLRRLQRAFDAAEGETKREFGERLIEAYEREGLTAEAQAVRDRLAE